MLLPSPVLRKLAKNLNICMNCLKKSKIVYHSTFVALFGPCTYVWCETVMALLVLTHGTETFARKLLVC